LGALGITFAVSAMSGDQAIKRLLPPLVKVRNELADRIDEMN
jgi:hypothetical protein